MNAATGGEFERAADLVGARAALGAGEDEAIVARVATMPYGEAVGHLFSELDRAIASS